MIEKLKWLGHASFRIDGERIVYFDPWQLPGRPPLADVILITHSHYDHCSKDDIKKIYKKGTVIVASPDCAEALPWPIVPLSPGGRTEANGIPVEAVRAYNLDKKFHPRANGWNGYVVAIGGTRFYHTGDSDVVPEMKDVRADVILVPVGGTYTMDASEAARAVEMCKAKIAVPMHFGSIVGSRADAERLKKASRAEVVILEPTR